jgi:hypothetical protein
MLHFTILKALLINKTGDVKMFGKKKIENDRYIVAVKDYENTIKLMKEGKVSLPYDSAIYLKMLDSQNSKVDNYDDLKKFIKINDKVVKEVLHAWEGLISSGYTLINVAYQGREPSLERLCSRDLVKFVSVA